MTIDDVLSGYDHVEKHSTWIAAEPAHVLQAVEEVTLAEIPLVSSLLALRELPAVLTRRHRLPRPARRSVLSLLEDEGFVRLDEDPEREILFGVVGKFWRPAGNAPLRLAGAGEFLAFTEPGNAKAVIDFRAEPDRGGTRLTTETRIATTDETARRSFARYWRVIRPGSGLIRIVWLRAIKRRAER